MGKVFFSSGEIVVNGSRDAGVSNDNHDNLEAIFEKRHAFKAFFRRLVKEIFSRNSCRSILFKRHPVILQPVFLLRRQRVAMIDKI